MKDMARIASILDPPIHHALLANDVGTWKTISALSTLVDITRDAQKLIKDGVIVADASSHGLESPQDTVYAPQSLKEPRSLTTLRRRAL